MLQRLFCTWPISTFSLEGSEKLNSPFQLTLKALSPRFNNAEPLLQRALEIRQKNLIGSPLDYALCLEKVKESLKTVRGLPLTTSDVAQVARLHRVMGKYSESERAAKRSLQIYLESLGVDYPAIEQHNTYTPLRTWSKN